MGDGAVTLKAIVFDLDGTLYQDDRLGAQVSHSAVRYVAELKGVSEAEAEALIEKQRRENRDGGTLSRAVVALGGNLKEMHLRFARDVRPEGLLIVDERVPALLRSLASRYRLILYTNNNRDLSARIMERIGVTGIMHEVITIEDFWLPKPDLKVIAAILEKAGVNPEETLFVGDRYEVDLAAPESIGCRIFETRTVDELLTLSKLLD